MKKLIVILFAIISVSGFCQSPTTVTKKEHKDAVAFIRKQLPKNYQKVPMIYREHASRELDSADAKGIRSYVRFYEFTSSNICDSTILFQVCTNGAGIKPKTYIYYTVEKIDSHIHVCVVSGE